MPKKVEEGARRWLCRPPLPPPLPPPADTSHHLTTAPVHPTYIRPAALFYRLKQKGFKECTKYSDAYAACCKDRVISIVWACRSEMKALSDCMGSQ